MKVVERYSLITKETEYGITEVDTVNGRQLYPYTDRAMAYAQLRFEKLKQRGAKDRGRFRDRQFESVLIATDRI
jgi:hypothetical protein